MKSSVIIFPGSNCDRDMDVALKKFGFKNKMVWHNDNVIPKSDLVVLPGGFSYGDYLRCGSIAAKSNIINSVIEFANKGGLVIGICNGFQILIEANLLEGSLINNDGVKFKSKEVSLLAKNLDTAFTNLVPENKELFMPIAHRQGNYIASDDLQKKLIDNSQIAFTYSSSGGGNPNGSNMDIAGIFNENKNILGMMPHPERASDSILGSDDGALIFKSIINKG